MIPAPQDGSGEDSAQHDEHVVLVETERGSILFAQFGEVSEGAGVELDVAPGDDSAEGGVGDEGEEFVGGGGEAERGSPAVQDGGMKAEILGVEGPPPD